MWVAPDTVDAQTHIVVATCSVAHWPPELFPGFSGRFSRGFESVAEDLLEVADQHLRGAALDYFSDFRIESGRDEAVETAYARKHDVHE